MTLINQIYKLALEAYGEEKTSSLTLYQTLYEHFPESFIIYKKDNEVLGYIILCFLSDNDFTKTTQLNFSENQLNFSKQLTKTSNVYFFSIIIKPNNSKYIIFNLLSQLKLFIKKHQIKNISALIYTKNGEKLAKILDMDQVSNNIFIKKI